jgi:GDPmannose 4,6-dehydratase
MNTLALRANHCAGWCGSRDRPAGQSIASVDEPDDYLVATGTSYTVRDLLRSAFNHVRLGWDKHVRFDLRYLRPSELDNLIGDALKAVTRLGWSPTVLTPDLARLMVDTDVSLLSQPAPASRA